MIIVFSGLDGSGKTTCAESISGYLRKRGFTVRNTHIIKDSLHYRLLHNFVGRISESSKNSLEDSLRDRKGRGSFLISRFIKESLLLLNILYFDLKFGWYRKDKKRVLVTDRYFYDEIVQAKYLGIAGKIFTFIFIKLTIMPDMVFFLKADPLKAYGRKKEYEKDYFEKKDILYTSMYNTVPHIRIPEMAINDMISLISGHVNTVVGAHE